MRYLIFILLFPFCLLAQKNDFSLGQLEGNPQSPEKICYAFDGDTLEGTKIHTFDIISGYGFVIVDLLGSEVQNAIPLASKYCNCQTKIIAVEPKFDYIEESGDSEQLYTLFSKFDNPHPGAASYPGSFTFIIGCQ